MNVFSRNVIWQTKQRTAFTLLELILALAVSAFVLLAVGMAVRFHLHTLDFRSGEVEELQLARAIVAQMTEDIHSTAFVPVAEQDAAESDEAVDGEELVDDVPTADSETTSIAEDIEPPLQPGLYGNQFELQIDTSRLPRPDQYAAVYSPDTDTTVDLATDTKTVAWYLHQETGAIVGTQPGQGNGLVRRSFDRAATLWAIDNGDIDALQSAGTLLASEVRYLEFAYFDGMEWLSEWDSSEMSGLPLAIRITLGLESARSSDQTEDEFWGIDADDLSELLILRTVVELPTAFPILEPHKDEEASE